MGLIRKCDVCGRCPHINGDFGAIDPLNDITAWFTVGRSVGSDFGDKHEVCSIDCGILALTTLQHKNEAEMREALEEMGE